MRGRDVPPRARPALTHAVWRAALYRGCAPMVCSPHLARWSTQEAMMFLLISVWIALNLVFIVSLCRIAARADQRAIRPYIVPSSL